ncbi:hypothetical protein [Glutamicibacter sp.]|uniref:hypothetical protein n=1 Tax=Glutamicibacter sp. TaxID=1931995 RepID=UPI0028BE107B|nr:hypothetical protein [Glutamicibacter sp.]
MNRYQTMTTLGAVVLLIFLSLMAVEVAWVRVMLAVIFCVALPGSGWAVTMRLKDVGDTLAMSVMLSLSSTVLVATVMAVGDFFNVFLGFGILALITVAGVIAALGKKPRHANQG